MVKDLTSTFRLPAVDPTLVIVGLNRSGTTALSHSFSNHPAVEVFKDPGKHVFEATGIVDFSHYFTPRLRETSKLRVIKQSIGQYTAELCTIPIYPMMERRPDFIRKVHHVFLLRRPSDIWQSWQTMSRLVHTSDDLEMRRAWRQLQRDKGFDIDWGNAGLFDLAFRYFYQTFLYVSKIAPESTRVILYDEIVDRDLAACRMQEICSSVGLSFTEDMIEWVHPFGVPAPNVVDGIRRPIDDPHRQMIHRKLLKSSRIGDLTVDPPGVDLWPELDRMHSTMSDFGGRTKA
ncbi:hypothetical protein ACIA49_13095 [Kribbella sp. NPDC051587]|uniref:hypothetical protein n=1 Tax=Kribbella sp. NPDC051587 TaxID=3364119 RepID=UPI0037AD4090